ncbi:sensor histidine kinase [Anabaena sp. UHCC 0399]|uniref:sensor histidine kinase n=1 Tax=Anabaena sp. UHCC 0399 TaxID=3110238 RepID=UPI002B1FA77C|nr:ATP-binding protein [Anabaena sp. UHCC 0399]MEA5565038.1 ATP-binding protein [Anabaena sp. UHCC 0399]
MNCEEKIQKLEKANRILQKKLDRAAIDRMQLEETNRKKESLLKKVINELQESQTQLQQRTLELEQTLINLQTMQDKMSVLGGLVADVAHEINNPVCFIIGNITPAIEYIHGLLYLIDLYQQCYPDPLKEIKNQIKVMDLEYVCEDLPKLIMSMKEGTDRISNLSSSLRIFARADTEFKLPFNIHEGINSTLFILKHRLKANQNRPEIQVIKKFGDIPIIDCFPGQLNQVFMNIFANAIDALEESNSDLSFAEIQTKNNQIIIQTSLDHHNNYVLIRIKDNALGISEDVKAKIFEHSFTTKPVGKGTGLGLSIAHQIIVQKHGGTLEVESVLGEGTEFAIAIPIY